MVESYLWGLCGPTPTLLIFFILFILFIFFLYISLLLLLLRFFHHLTPPFKFGPTVLTVIGVWVVWLQWEGKAAATIQLGSIIPTSFFLTEFSKALF